MKILIIGSKGMLGQELVKTFSSGHEVAAWDREEIDIVNTKDLRFKTDELRPELVINSAAYNDLDGAEEKPELAQAVNGYAVGSLASVCRNLNIPLVHYSTDYVFDGANLEEGYRENDQPNPLSAYGRSKLLGEQELQKNIDQFYLIRLSRLFGKEPKALGAKKSFVKLMLDLAETQKAIEVVDEEISLPSYARDVAGLTRHLIEQKLSYGIYHAANSGEPVTWFGLANEIFKISGRSVKLLPVPRSRLPSRATRPQYSILLNTKLPPQRPWQEALREFLAQD